MFKTLGFTLILISMALPCVAQVASGSPEERLFQAVWADDLAKVRTIVNEGVNIYAENSRAKTAIDMAVDKGYFNIVHYLLQRAEQQKKQKLKNSPKRFEFEIVEAPLAMELAPPEPFISEPLKKNKQVQFKVIGPDPFAPSAPVASGLAQPHMQTQPNLQKDTIAKTIQSKRVAVPQKKPEQQIPAKQIPAKHIPAKQEEVKFEDLSDKVPLSLSSSLSPPPPSFRPKSRESHQKRVPHADLNGALALALGRTLVLSDAKKARFCIKKGKSRAICIEKTIWSEGLFNHFSDLNISIYKRFGLGGRAVVGYHDGAATFIKTIFAVADFDNVVRHFTKQYGKPDDRQERIVAPLGKPQKTYPVLSWYGFDATAQRKTVLQIIQYDSPKNQFAKMTEGAIIYKYINEPSLFSFVNTIELVRLP